MSTRLQRASGAPYLHAFTSSRLQRAARPPALWFARQQRCSSTTYLHTCIPQRRYARNAPPDLQTSRPPIPPRLHACIAPPKLRSSIPLRGDTPVRRQAASSAPYLHVCTSTAHPTSLHLQRTSR